MCSRPAVSMRTTSAPSAMPSLTASKAIEAGSPPSGPRTVRAPTRSPQVCSWSAAAARKVSAAPRTTERPSATSTRASLPVVVVLPVPFTPTTITMPGVSRPDSVLHRAVEVRADQREQLLAQQRAQVVRGAGAEHADALAQPLDQFLGGGDADVGGQQRVLDLLPRVLVQVLAGEEREQPLAERVLRAREARAQPDQATCRGLRGLDLRGGRLLDDHGGRRRRLGEREFHLLDRAARFVARRLGLVADVRLGRRGGDGGRGRRGLGGSCFFLRLPITSPPSAPITTTAMTTARMTISITHPVSAMGATGAQAVASSKEHKLIEGTTRTKVRWSSPYQRA